MEHLMAGGEKMIVPVLLYLFRQIEKRLDGRPTLITLDEAWLMLSHPLCIERVRDWLKTFRKKNCAVVLATQELADYLKSPICDTILQNCLTKILLPNPEATSPAQRKMYEQLGLNEREIQILATATPKREYYYRSPAGKRLLSLGLGPATLAFVGVSDSEEVERVRRCIAKFGAAWPGEWLDAKGLAAWGTYWRRLAEASPARLAAE
jgi:type IV secretion system protein TrbE